MNFAHYDLLLDVIERDHRRSKEPAYLRLVRQSPRSRGASGRPRSLPRGRPGGPPEAA